jgi:hypothetical protein
MHTRQQGQENNPVFNQLRGEYNHPSQENTRRWSMRGQGVGHYRPYVMNGNRQSEVLVGELRFKLVMYRITFPKATAAELNAASLFNADKHAIASASLHCRLNQSQ